MARIPKPWYREDRQAWFVTIRGQRHNLGPDDQEAQRLFHELMAEKPKPTSPTAPVALSVALLFEKFLDWSQRNQAPATYEWYRGRIQSFIDHLDRPTQLAAEDLKSFHVVEWIDAHADWGPTFRHGSIRSVQRTFNWAVELGYLDRSPVRGIKKPSPQRRQEALSPEEWQGIRAHYPEGDPFRDFLEFCWDTGCRPYEARSIEPRHAHLDRRCVLFPPDEAKGKKRWRVIRLTDNATAILRRQIAGRSEGKAFLNAEARPWTAFAINCRFCRLQVATGRAKMKELGITVPDEELDRFTATLRKTKKSNHRTVAKTDAELREEAYDKLTARMARKYGRKCFAYAFRHGFATRKLIAGHDHLTVAELLGHADGTMLARVYAHLDQADDHLRKALEG